MNSKKMNPKKHRLLHSPQKRVVYLDEPDSPKKTAEQIKQDERAEEEKKKQAMEMEAKKAEALKKPRTKLNL